MLLDLNTRSCLLIPPGEHFKPSKDIHVSNYKVVKYPDAVKDSFLGAKSPLHLVRKVATQVIREADASAMDVLYAVGVIICFTWPVWLTLVHKKGWLHYYGAGPYKRTDWSEQELLTHAKVYATKVLLRGSEYGGSKVIPIAGEQSTVPEISSDIPASSSRTEPGVLVSHIEDRGAQPEAPVEVISKYVGCSFVR